VKTGLAVNSETTGSTERSGKRNLLLDLFCGVKQNAASIAMPKN
jgi:hypothetical protein